jgi:hypothetical protein
LAPAQAWRLPGIGLGSGAVRVEGLNVLTRRPGALSAGGFILSRAGRARPCWGAQREGGVHLRFGEELAPADLVGPDVRRLRPP